MVALYYRFRTWFDVILALILVYGISGREIGKAIFNILTAEDKRNLLLNLFSSAISLMGFVLTAGTFLIVHIQDEAFSILRASKSYRGLVALISSAIWRLFGLAGASLALLVSGPKLDVIAQRAVIFFVTVSALSIVALIRIIIQVFLVHPKGMSRIT